MKVYQTNKLYFGKWIYKVETSTPGASLIKRWGVEDSTDFCNNPKDRRYPHTYTLADKTQLLEYIQAVEPFFGKELQMRAEWDTLNFYLNDAVLYQQLQTALSKWVVSVTEPATDTDIVSLQGKSSLILCNELPHGKFEYRLYIRYQMPPHQRLVFLKWLDNYKDSILPSKGTYKWLLTGKAYFQDPFLYITDSSLLLMVSLCLGEYARSTQRFVLRDA